MKLYEGMELQLLSLLTLTIDWITGELYVPALYLQARIPDTLRIAG